MIFISFFRTSIWEKLAFRLDGSTIFKVLSFEKWQQNLMKNHIDKKLEIWIDFRTILACLGSSWELSGRLQISCFFSKLNKFHTFFSKTESGFRIFGILGAKTCLSRLHRTIWGVIWDDFVHESPPQRHWMIRGVI